MNQKTDVTTNNDALGQREFSPDFIRLLVALTGATLLIVFLFEHRVVVLPQQHMMGAYMHPWVVAGGLTIAKGLAEFSGENPVIVGTTVRLAALLGLLFGFVIGPTLFFFGWYNRRKESASGTRNPALKGSAVISIIGGILAFTIAIPSIPIAIIQTNVSSELRSAQAVQSNKDLMINDLNFIQQNAVQYRILPKRLGGGEGSYSGYTIPQALGSTDEGIYTVVAETDEVTIDGVSKKYKDCTIVTRVNKEGDFEPGSWIYGGRFQ